MPRPQVDPELARALSEGADGSPPSLLPSGIAQARRRVAAVTPSARERAAMPGLVVEELLVPGPAGAPEVAMVLARRSPPETRQETPRTTPPPGSDDVTAGSTTTSSPAPARPCVVHVHGGGMVTGDHLRDLDEPLSWVSSLDVVVVSPNYRLAPEHPFPAAVEDCWAVLTWVVEHAGELGVDPARVVVAGISAGGGLAASLALMARDRGGPALAGQLLVCPMLDDRSITPSSHEVVGELVWDRTSNSTGWDALLGEARGSEGVSPYAAPARSQDLSGLAPAFVDVGSVDGLRDEDVDYALRLWRAGGEAELHVWPGGFHAFDHIAPGADLSRRSTAVRLDWLRRVVSR